MSAVPAQPWRTPPPSATVMELLDRAQASLLHASQAGAVGARRPHRAGARPRRGRRPRPASRTGGR